MAEKCILFANYCYKNILANMKLSISHSKGMNSGVDNLSHLDLLWGKMFCLTFKHLAVVAIHYFEKFMFEAKPWFQTIAVQFKGGRKFELFLSFSSSLLLNSLAPRR